MGRKKVLLFTDSFPFGHNESFLESELREWGNRGDVEIIIFPILDTSGVQREIPSNSILDVKLSTKLKFFEKWIFLLFPLIFFNPFFWKELKIYTLVLFNLKKLRKLVAVSTFSKIIYQYLKKNYKNELNSNSIFYSYWFYYAAYAGALLKRKHFNFTLITRAHGTDVFQNRKDTGCYIPFRRFPIWKYFFKIFPVSEEGKRYLNQNQDFPLSKLEVSNLGINPPNIISSHSLKNNLSLVSCSNIIPVKRINLIIDGLAYYKEKYPNIELFWHHIGDGTFFSQIFDLADKNLSPLGISFKFHGQLKNSDVMNFYSKTPIDCFITTSSSEGLPVSIMEALCFGIPVLATAVGGIPEAVNKNVGYILDENFSNDDFVNGLNKMHDFKPLEKREEIALWGKQKYSASVNHNAFILKIISK